MDVEKEDVEDGGKHDQAGCSGQEVFDDIGEGFGAVAEHDPQLLNGVQAHQKNHKQAHKFNRYCATEHTA